MKSKRGDLFLPIFTLWYMTEIFFNTTLESFLGFSIMQLNGITNYLILILLMIQIIFFQTYKKKELFIIAVVSIPIIISAARSSNYSLLSALMFIIASKNTDFEKSISVAYKILCIMIPLVIVSRFLGIIDDYIVMREGIVRYSLGFSHPNQLGLRLFQLLACHLYINRNKLKSYNYFIAIVIVVLIYLIPNSKTAYICTFLLILLLMIYEIFQKHNQLMIEIYGRVLILFSVAFNVLSVIWSLIDVRCNFILHQIDLFMSRRFSYCYQVFQLYGISVWGQKIYISEDEVKLAGIIGKLYLDNGYMAIMIRYGIIVYIVFSICYLLAMHNFKKKNQYFLLIILFVYALYGVMENGIYMVTHNIFLISLGNMLYEKSIRKARENGDKAERHSDV